MVKYTVSTACLNMYIMTDIRLLTLNIKVHLAEEIFQVLEDTLVAASIRRLGISDDESEGSPTLTDLVLVSITTDLEVRGQK